MPENPHARLYAFSEALGAEVRKMKALYPVLEASLPDQDRLLIEIRDTLACLDGLVGQSAETAQYRRVPKRHPRLDFLLLQAKNPLAAVLTAQVPLQVGTPWGSLSDPHKAILIREARRYTPRRPYETEAETATRLYAELCLCQSILAGEAQISPDLRIPGEPAPWEESETHK